MLLTEGFLPNPDVNHDPFHPTSNTKKERQESVHPKATFAWDKTQEIFYILAFLKHV